VQQKVKFIINLTLTIKLIVNSNHNEKMEKKIPCNRVFPKKMWRMLFLPLDTAVLNHQNLKTDRFWYEKAAEQKKIDNISKLRPVDSFSVF
jgi:hypothetical protein